MGFEIETFDDWLLFNEGREFEVDGEKYILGVEYNLTNSPYDYDHTNIQTKINGRNTTLLEFQGNTEWEINEAKIENIMKDIKSKVIEYRDNPR